MDPEYPDPRFDPAIGGPISTEAANRLARIGESGCVMWPTFDEEAIAEARTKGREALERGLAAALAVRGNGPQDAAERPTAPAESPRTSGGSGDAHRAAAIEAAARALWRYAQRGNYPVTPWEEIPDRWVPEKLAQAAAAYDAIEPLVRRAVAASIEHPTSPLCECPPDNPPVGPDGKRIDHHCECPAVLAAAAIARSFRATAHGRQCICAPGMDEIYYPESEA